MPPVQERHANRLWRRSSHRAPDPRRRTARRPRRSRGRALCRTRRTPPRPLSRRSRHRARRCLRHQCRQALQMGAPRQAPPPQETQRPRNRRLPPLARRGNGGDSARDDRLPGRHRRPGSPRPRLSRHTGSRQAPLSSRTAPGPRDRPPVVHPARPRPRQPRAGPPRLRPRPPRRRRLPPPPPPRRLKRRGRPPRPPIPNRAHHLQPSPKNYPSPKILMRHPERSALGPRRAARRDGVGGAEGPAFLPRTSTSSLQKNLRGAPSLSPPEVGGDRVGSLSSPRAHAGPLVTRAISTPHQNPDASSRAERFGAPSRRKARWGRRSRGTCFSATNLNFFPSEKSPGCPILVASRGWRRQGGKPQFSTSARRTPRHARHLHPSPKP